MLEPETGPNQEATPSGVAPLPYVVPGSLSASNLSPVPSQTPSPPSVTVPVSPKPPEAAPIPEPKPEPPLPQPPAQYIKPAQRSSMVEPVGLGQKTLSVGYFLFGASLAAIVATLGLMALKAQRASAVAQTRASYDSEVQSQLNNKKFQEQEKKVNAIGQQVNLLKKSLADRVMFSQFFSELEKVTYKKAQFTSVSANNESVVTIEGSVVDFYELSKTLKALKTSTGFESVELANVTVEKEKGKIQFSVQIQLKTDLLRPPVKSASTQPSNIDPSATDASQAAADTVDSLTGVDETTSITAPTP